MTVLLIGGRGQGKRALAEKLFHLSATDFLDGATGSVAALSETAAVNRLHLLTRRMLAEGNAPNSLLPLLQGKIILCDELGSGVVPMEHELDEWRETTGRLCCELAEQADLVIRVTAGLPQVLKGTLPD